MGGGPPKIYGLFATLWAPFGYKLYCGTKYVGYQDGILIMETTHMSIAQVDPPPCNSDIMGLLEERNIITIIPYNHYYREGGPPKV